MLHGVMVPTQTWWCRLWSWGMPRTWRPAEPLPAAAVPPAGEDLTARAATGVAEVAAAPDEIDADVCILGWLLEARPRPWGPTMRRPMQHCAGSMRC